MSENGEKCQLMIPIAREAQENVPQLSSNLLFCSQAKYIQFIVIEKERKLKIFTFKELENFLILKKILKLINRLSK